ncbi:MAG: septum formation initiator family protein [Bacteroidota bacterium]|nr:septum formation initiator family protein [Bacteroidota bacterium]
MKIFKQILSVLKNRYVITIAIAVVWLLFFDRNDVFSQYERHQEVKKLEAEHSYYKTEIGNNKREGIELQSNLKLLEKFGREHYLMKKDNEDIYVLVEDSLEKK